MITKSQKILILLGVLAVLVIIWLVWQNPWQNNKPAELDSIFTADMTQANKIEIIQGETTTTLTKTDDNWQVEAKESSKANQFLIDNLIEAVTQSQKGTLISQNEEKFANFMLTSENARKLKIYDQSDNLLVDLLVGKFGVTGSSQTYIRLPEDNKIYLVEAGLLSSINQTDWKEPPPVEMDNEAAVELETESIKTEPIE